MKPLLTLVLIIVCFTGYSQTGTIKGHVYDTVRYEWLRALIIIENDNYRADTVSCLEGYYTLKNVPRGFYKLTVFVSRYRVPYLTHIWVAPDSISRLAIHFPQKCPYNSKSKFCPVCRRKSKVVPVWYGFYSSRVYELEKNGEFKLGGCLIFECNPQWYCKRDSTYF